MRLDGSCHCGAVQFSLESAHPHPFALCYCSVCRKTAGAGGYAINLGGDAASLTIKGDDHIRVYRARVTGAAGAPALSPLERRFCGLCGSMLWCWDPRWPDLVHPFASAVDTMLPVPPERTHLMLGSKASWVVPHIAPTDKAFDAFPEESLAQWHERLGLVAEG